MSGYAPRRPLGEVVTELSEALVNAPLSGGGGMSAGSIEVRLPVEMLIEQRDGDWIVCADSPRTRRRTDFDLPLGQLWVRLEAEARP